MGKYNYSFVKFGSLLRSEGIPLVDANGNYISGEQRFVWWWPINWIVIAVWLLILVQRRLLRKEE